MDQPENPAAVMAQAAAEDLDLFAPVFEAANGLRARLATEGWTPAVAEQIAAAWLIQTIGPQR